MPRIRVGLALFDVNYVTSALKYVQVLAGGLDPARFDPVIVSFLPTAKKSEAGAPVRSLDSFGRAALLSAPKLARLFGGERIDVLLSSCTGPNMAACGARLLRGPGTAVGIIEHNTFSLHEGAKPFKTALARLLYPRADRVITVSGGVEADLLRLVPALRGRTQVVYNPVLTPPDRLQRMAAEPSGRDWLDRKSGPVILNVGELYPRKGQETLIRAFALVRREIDARLIIAGTPVDPTAGDLDRLARELGVRGHVEFAGFVDNPFALMRRADVFALSSLEEGFGLVLVEAMACGCPVVSTDCPSGPAEIIRDGESGLLVPVGDPPAMASALMRVLRDTKLAGRLRTAGIERAAFFSLDTFLGEMSAVIENLAGMRHG